MEKEYHAMRIIPSLLLQIQAGSVGLYKTQKFKNPSYIGDAMNAVKIFNDKGADECILLDITARRAKNPPNFAVIEEIAGEAFMPIGYGGGIDTPQQAEQIINLGVEKIILTHDIWNNIANLRKISDKIGSQSVVVCVNIKKNIWGNYVIYDYVHDKNLNINIPDYINQCIANGCGEIILQNIDRDGTMMGFDFDLIDTFAHNIPVPVILAGGCAGIDDIKQAATRGISAISVGAKFVYMGKHRAVMINYPNTAEYNDIQSGFMGGLS